jgi:hypothetical protein
MAVSRCADCGAERGDHKDYCPSRSVVKELAIEDDKVAKVFLKRLGMQLPVEGSEGP